MARLSGMRHSKRSLGVDRAWVCYDGEMTSARVLEAWGTPFAARLTPP
jgi:hypothetical protein